MTDITEEVPLDVQWNRMAIEQHNLPADWYAWKFAVTGRVSHLRVWGAVCAPKTRGPNAGKPNVRKKLSHYKSVVIKI